MALLERPQTWTRLAFFLGGNWVSLLGAILTTSSGITLVVFWGMETLAGRSVHPYAGIALFLILPIFFVAGLVLMPLGALWRRRRLRRSGELPSVSPR